MITTLPTLVTPPTIPMTQVMPMPEDGKAYWSQHCEDQPPAVGTRVRIHIWEGITGTVVGYEVTHGWLMVWVKPDYRPKWHVEQNPDRHICLFAGIELDW